MSSPTTQDRQEIKVKSLQMAQLITSATNDFICSSGVLSKKAAASELLSDQLSSSSNNLKPANLIAKPYLIILKKLERNIKLFAGSKLAPNLSLSPSILRPLVESAREDQLGIRQMDRIENLENAAEALNKAVSRLSK